VVFWNLRLQLFQYYLLSPLSTLKKEVTNSFEISIPIYKIASRCIPGDKDFYIQSHVKLNSTFDVITDERQEDGKKQIKK